jgi:Cu-Zn family superoxide dismutase
MTPPGYSHTIEIVHSFSLPGSVVFPESIGVDHRSGDAYTGSMADGAIYRLPPDAATAEVWSSAGADGRDSVAGVKVDDGGRLWAAGGYSGALWVYEIDGGQLLARLDVGSRPSCVNDIAFGLDGDAYVTDSFVPTLFRVDGHSLALEPFVDLAEQGMPWADGLNLNGIVLSPDREHLVSCQTNLGRFWRLELASRRLEEVALAGGPLEHCDGLALDGSTLYVAVNARNLIAVIELADDGAAGKVLATLVSDAFAFPTAVATSAERLLVVNGQLDRMGAEPQLPFTVVAATRPGL